MIIRENRKAKVMRKTVSNKLTIFSLLPVYGRSEGDIPITSV